MTSNKHRSSRTGNSPRQDKNTQQPSNKKEKRGHDRQHQIEILQKRATVHGILDKNHFRGTRDGRNQQQTKCGMGSIPQKSDQELTSKAYRLCHRLRLFNMVITPTMTYASGTWTRSQTHERMIKTAQRKMLRLIVETNRKYKVKSKKETKETSTKHRKNNRRLTLIVRLTRKLERGSEPSSDKDQDSDVLPCWTETHRRMKWRMAGRIASLPKRNMDKQDVRLASWS